MTYSLSNSCTKNYYNRTLTVQVIVEDVVTWIFLETQCSIPAVKVVRMPVYVRHDVILQVEAGDVADAAADDSTVQSNGGDDVCDADGLGLSDSVCGSDELIAEQHSDAGLADCLQQPKVCKGGFVISGGMLYHEDEVNGLPVGQLCGPQSKSVHELTLAYNSASDYHPRVCEIPDRNHLLF